MIRKLDFVLPGSLQDKLALHNIIYRKAAPGSKNYALLNNRRVIYKREEI